jgi:hypothetical protein
LIRREPRRSWPPPRSAPGSEAPDGASDGKLVPARPATTSLPRRYSKHHWTMRSHNNLEVEFVAAVHAYHLPALIFAAGGAISYAGTVESLCLDEISQRPHQGRWCFGKTPMQTFLDAMPMAKEKMIAA